MSAFHDVDVRDYVARRVGELQARYLRNESSAVSDLARLRKGVARSPGSDLELVGLTIADLHPESARLPDDPTDAEHAAYRAITLFALHQQSHRDARMHQSGHSFGRSTRLLVQRGASEEAVRRRFAALGTANSWAEIGIHTRGIIQQFRAAGIPLDYGDFAKDLLALRFPGSADRVRTSWGREFYRTRNPDSSAVDDQTSDQPAHDELTK